MEQETHKKEATRNLLSPKGIEMRVNRSIQVEGVFGIIKQDYGRDRLQRRGIIKVKLEIDDANIKLINIANVKLTTFICQEIAIS